MREDAAERSSAIFKAVGAAVIYFAMGVLLARLALGRAVLQALIQPIPVLVWARRSGASLGVETPTGGWAVPTMLFCAAALAASWVLPGAEAVPFTVREALRLCAVVPAVEELVFRGAVQGFLRLLGSHAAVVAAAALFAVQHGSAAGMLYAFCMGLVLGWLRESSRSVLPGILLHSVNNLLVFLAG